MAFEGLGWFRCSSLGTHVKPSVTLLVNKVYTNNIVFYLMIFLEKDTVGLPVHLNKMCVFFLPVVLSNFL